MVKRKKKPIKEINKAEALRATKKKQRHELLGPILCEVMVLAVILGGTWGLVLHLG